MNLVPIAQLIEDAGLAKSGTDLFLHSFPAEIETGVLVRSPLGGTKVDYELPEYRKTSFQIIVRTHTQKYLSGDAIARGIFKELTYPKFSLIVISSNT